jgi:HSP90 family molecular chaperone
LQPVENNVSHTKSKKDYGVFTKTLVQTLRSCEKEQNKTRERTKTDSSSSSGQNHGQNQMESSTYEDEENSKRNTEEILNCQKNSPIPNCKKNKWKENQIPTDSSSRELGPTINKTYSNTVAVNIKRCNDRKYLIFDKRDFLFPQTTTEILGVIQK